jgi:hypothetical protein
MKRFYGHITPTNTEVCVSRIPIASVLSLRLQLTAGGEVNYISEPLTEWLKNTPLTMEPVVLKNLILICLKTKSPVWRYEKEAKLIRRESRVFNIDGKFMTQVCFGLRTPQADIDLVIKLARDYCGCTRFGQMVRDVLFILEMSEPAKAAIGKRVTVVDYPDGRLSIRYRGVELAYRTFDKIQQVDQAAIADNKRLGAVLAMIRDQQLQREPEHRSTKAPRRRDQHNARLFKVG